MVRVERESEISICIYSVVFYGKRSSGNQKDGIFRTISILSLEEKDY